MLSEAIGVMFSNRLTAENRTMTTNPEHGVPKNFYGTLPVLTVSQLLLALTALGNDTKTLLLPAHVLA